MDAALRARLADIAGAGAVDDDSVSPASTEQLDAVCAALAEAGARIAVTSEPASRTPVRSGTVLVSVSRFDAVEVEAERLVAKVGAGATLAGVGAALDRAGLTLATPVPGGAPDVRIGELVARGRLARRAFTGIEAVLPGGGRVGAGGAVLKDVAGYDLVGALLGSMGRLALVTGVSLRLQPKGVAQAPGAEAPGAVRGVLGDALESAFDPGRLLTARS
ncbi:MAG TPA: FAD-binding protein [Candidatus Dormibacteraeota bacterium]|jgi:glycolate oxidase FAD binding subunit|nr:FAD-binding protein [Candidatus Dormibacteraeota bacterium]